MEYLLTQAGIPFDAQVNIEGKPDIVIPGKQAYNDPTFPLSKLCVLGVKRTCKDRWRQVTHEARRVPTKHLLTLQESISRDQLDKMRKDRITLVVPCSLRPRHPLKKSADEVGLPLFDVESFIKSIKQMLA